MIDNRKEISWDDWDIEFHRAFIFYQILGFDKLEAREYARNDVNRKFYTLAGG